MTPIVELDLRRDLPKVRKSWARLLRALPEKQCAYVAPCVIGVMVPPAKRKLLDDQAEVGISRLIDLGVVAVPPDQKGDFSLLQIAFDDGDLETFESRFARVEAKYMPASVDTHPEGGDAKQAPFMSGAVGAEGDETPIPSLDPKAP